MNSLRKPPGRWRRFLLMGCLGAAAVLVLALLLLNPPSFWGRSQAAQTSVLPQGVVRYIRLHQWQADSRTLLAMVQFLLEPPASPPPASTNRYRPWLVNTNQEPAADAA